MKRGMWLLLGMGLMAPAVAADDVRKPGVVAFNASVRVDVDASGKPVKVEAPADLPDSIRSFIEKRVASWQYQPAKAAGVPVGATTYVKVGACAIPDATSGGYKLGVDFKGNGPRLVSASGNLPPPQYPIEALRKSVTGTYIVNYSIQPDGSTQVGDIKLADGSNYRLKQGGYAVTDLHAQYRITPSTTVSMNVSNLFDRKYFRAIATGAGNFYGEPRKVSVTLRSTF